MSILLSILPAFAFGAQDASSRTKTYLGRSRSTTITPVQTVQSLVETSPPVTPLVWHMKSAAIRDRLNGGDESRELTAMSILIPVNWTFAGAPEYPTIADCSFTYGRIRFHACSPDGLTGIRAIPMTASVWSDNRAILQEIHGQNQLMTDVQQIRIEPPKSISQSLLETIRRLLPGSQVERSPEPMPELTGQLKPMLAQINRRSGKQATATGRPAPRMSAKAARVRVSWVHHGKRIEAWVVALQTVKTERLPIGGNLVTNDLPLLAMMHAPEGKLDGLEGMLTGIWGSVQLHQEWQAEIAQTNLKRIQKILSTRARLTEMAQDNLRTQQTVAALQADVQQYRSGVISLVGTTSYAALGRVKLSNQALHAWISGAAKMNEYILTDSPSYNPNGRMGGGVWTKLTIEP